MSHPQVMAGAELPRQPFRNPVAPDELIMKEKTTVHVNRIRSRRHCVRFNINLTSDRRFMAARLHGIDPLVSLIF